MVLFYSLHLCVNRAGGTYRLCRFSPSTIGCSSPYFRTIYIYGMACYLGGAGFMTLIHVINIDALVCHFLYVCRTWAIHILVVVVVVYEGSVVYNAAVVAWASPIVVEVVPVNILRAYEHPPVIGAIIAAECN